LCVSRVVFDRTAFKQKIIQGGTRRWRRKKNKRRHTTKKLFGNVKLLLDLNKYHVIRFIIQ